MKRSRTLIAIILYKAFVATLLSVASVAMLLVLKNHEDLETFATSYMLEGSHQMLDWGLEKLLNISPRQLRLSGIAMGVYAGVTAIEAVGLWMQKRWAEILVIVMVAGGLPLELFELYRGISPLKAIVLLINLAMLGYLVQDLKKKGHH